MHTSSGQNRVGGVWCVVVENRDAGGVVVVVVLAGGRRHLAEGWVVVRHVGRRVVPARQVGALEHQGGEGRPGEAQRPQHVREPPAADPRGPARGGGHGQGRRRAGAEDGARSVDKVGLPAAAAAAAAATAATARHE